MISKTMYKWVSLAAIIAGFSLIAGCDWSTGDDGFNSSRATAQINFSGFYKGNLGGGKAVSTTSGGHITSLVISQSGDTLEVQDNNGSKYRGRISGVAAVENPNVTVEAGEGGPTATMEAGAKMAQAQISFSGHDNVAAREIEFVGTIHAVVTLDIKGTVTTSSDGSQTDDTEGTSEVVIDEDTINRTVTVIEGDTVIETSVIIDRTTGAELGRTVTTRKVKEQTSSAGFVLSEQNSQYRLQGHWVEQPGVTATVDALAAGAAGIVTIPLNQ